MIEARFYRPGMEGQVQCFLCPHHCRIADGNTGICGVRTNRNGLLYSDVWGRPIAASADPVEKKPLFHFHPGSDIFSVATVGCNFRCLHCQNADISQMPADKGKIGGGHIPPEEIVRQAFETGCKSMAYTYTEPTVFYEYALDIARAARERGMKNVFVTNGFIEEEPLKEVAPYLDAANIDLKSFSDDFYRRVCGARLEPVLKSIALYRELGIWIEITTLLIPGLNDSDRELRQIARFIGNLGPEVPWHISRFYPTYRMTDRDGTSLETIRRAGEIGRDAGLYYIYYGNVPGSGGENTCCHHCRKEIIIRAGYHLKDYQIESGNCSHCETPLHGVGI
jgi:pyruvate formate lyase activating enzyme